jgi:hypothetical protein
LLVCCQDLSGNILVMEVKEVHSNYYGSFPLSLISLNRYIRIEAHEAVVIHLDRIAILISHEGICKAEARLCAYLKCQHSMVGSWHRHFRQHLPRATRRVELYKQRRLLNVVFSITKSPKREKSIPRREERTVSWSRPPLT